MYRKESILKKRFPSREIRIGNLLLGGKNPIRIQSMTTKRTDEAAPCAEQAMRLFDAGAEMVRITVQGKKEAKSAEEIKSLLIQKGYCQPLIADIHFYPPAALMVAQFVDKVRLNPGNFADRRARFKQIEYDGVSYASELDRIKEKFSPLVERCKRLKKAMRLGVNHGSLSDRIMSRYGDTPFGMVESAFEYARICRDMGYHDFCFSMKSSNPIVMIEAYRLLIQKMIEMGWDYPLHLGVTEAGEGQEGRLRSFVGIGSLLLDGIGDTIRVSLTEDPLREIEPCKQLVSLAEEKEGEIDFFLPPKRECIYPKGLERGLCLSEKQGELFLENGEKLPAESFDFFSPERSILQEGRKKAESLAKKGDTRPLIAVIRKGFSEGEKAIYLGTQLGSLLCDRIIDGICFEDRAFSQNLMQATRVKLTKADFISCPGCGRTLFDLEEVSRGIREETGHLKGVKIAIMGCIVNGPGEMADADFGYVGSKPGKIDLYVGKLCVERDIDMAEAKQKLVDLIRAHGKWVDAPRSLSSV